MEVDESKQVSFAGPLVRDPRVAIIGGGLSGLTCALRLARLGVRSVVFDTGAHSAGGRLATRAASDKSIHQKWLPAGGDRALPGASAMVFDHAAQFFTATDPRFAALVQEWLAAGAVKEWAGPVGRLDASRGGGAFAPLPAGSPARYVATRGMRQLAVHLTDTLLSQHGDLVEVRRPLWVGKMAAVTAGPQQGWQLTGEGRSQGIFDAVAIAHNGTLSSHARGQGGRERRGSIEATETFVRVPRLCSSFCCRRPIVMHGGKPRLHMLTCMPLFSLSLRPAPLSPPFHSGRQVRQPSGGPDGRAAGGEAADGLAAQRGLGGDGRL